MTRPPYVSVVVAARNDQHCGIARMQAFLNAWLAQAQRYDLPSEIVVVEWNPPPNRPRLMDALEWPAGMHPCQVRFIEVPEGVHRRFRNADVIPLHLLIAKNAGIRRARGEFVLATNPDIVFSPELMRFLAERRPERRAVYRVDRLDIWSGIPNPASVDQLLVYCENHILRILASEGTFPVGQDGLRTLEARDIALPGAGIFFGSGCYPVESDGDTLFRWLADEAEIILQRPEGAVPALVLDCETGPSAGGDPVDLQLVDPAGSLLASVSWNGRCQLRLRMPEHISAATLRLRIQSRGVPLDRDVRLLSLRLFKVRWEDPGFSAPARFEAGQRAPEGIRVRSIDGRRIQLELIPGPGSSLESLEANLTDLAGNTLFQMSTDQLQPARGRDCLLTLNIGFKLSGGFGSLGSQNRDSAVSEWFLEMTDLQPGVDWSTAFEAPSPWVAHMRNAAQLHTNGSGDFTLLSREDWLDLRGYPEFPIWPLHIDSLFCYAAHHAGMREIILRAPLRIFHIEHPVEDPDESNGVGRFQDHNVVKWVDQMRRFNAPVIFTRENWGLADVELPEKAIGP
jgi:hypothetical protein